MYIYICIYVYGVHIYIHVSLARNTGVMSFLHVMYNTLVGITVEQFNGKLFETRE